MEDILQYFRPNSDRPNIKLKVNNDIKSDPSKVSHTFNDYTGQQRKKNVRATVTYYVSTNSTVHVSGIRFSWN